MIKPLLFASLLALGSGCAPTPRPGPEAPALPAPTASDPSARAVEAPRPKESPYAPLLAELERAFEGQGAILRGELEGAALADAARAAGLADEARLVGWLERSLDDCLAARDDYADPCVKPDERADPVRRKLLAYHEALFTVLGEIVDDAPPAGALGAGARTLLRFSARNVGAAESALERLLERRGEKARARHACAPPTDEEIALAARGLEDFAVVDVARGGRPRALAPAERRDLAYLLAASRGAGVALMTTEEDRHAPSLPASHPAIAERAQLVAALREALFDGDAALHLSLSIRYLETLGYPDPIREHEEGDERWGGKGYSYLMREASRSAELAGELDLASELTRRANPGGGMCGTSFGYVRDEQMRRAIRVDEQRRGCRAAVPERLFGVLGEHERYGPEPLAKAGFDVERLYRGALLTLGRSDDAELAKSLARDARALARLRRAGREAWADRTRAVRGYADVAGPRAVPTLLGIARGTDAYAATQAIDAIADLGEDVGYDVCDPELLFGGGTWSSLQPRPVRALDRSCATKLRPAERKRWVGELGRLLRHPSAERRVAVAEALGKIGSPHARPLLERAATKDELADDTGCAPGSPGCVGSYPVREAATRALEELARIERIRADFDTAKRQRAELAAEGDDEGEPEAAPDPDAAASAD